MEAYFGSWHKQIQPITTAEVAFSMSLKPCDLVYLYSHSPGSRKLELYQKRIQHQKPAPRHSLTDKVRPRSQVPHNLSNNDIGWGPSVQTLESLGVHFIFKPQQHSFRLHINEQLNHPPLKKKNSPNINKSLVLVLSDPSNMLTQFQNPSLQER